MKKILLTLLTTSLLLSGCSLSVLVEKDSNKTEQPVEEIFDKSETEPEQEEISSTQEPRDVVTDTLFVAYCEDSITLRTTPNTSAGEITQIPYGATVGYIAPADNGFYKINYNGKTGYALAAYLAQEKPAAKTAKPTQTNATQSTLRVVNCDEWISMWVSPDDDSARITTIPKGAIVEYLSNAGGGYYKIRYDNKTGYSKAYYLQ